MILRVLTFRVVGRGAHLLEERAGHFLSPQGRPPRMIHGELGRQSDPDGDRFTHITVWPDLDALYEWLGGRDLLCSPRLFDGLDDSVTDVRIEHYEVRGMTTPLPVREPRGGDGQVAVLPPCEPN